MEMTSNNSRIKTNGAVFIPFDYQNICLACTWTQTVHTVNYNVNVKTTKIYIHFCSKNKFCKFRRITFCIYWLATPHHTFIVFENLMDCLISRHILFLFYTCFNSISDFKWATVHFKNDRIPRNSQQILWK